MYLACPECRVVLGALEGRKGGALEPRGRAWLVAQLMDLSLYSVTGRFGRASGSYRSGFSDRDVRIFLPLTELSNGLTGWRLAATTLLMKSFANVVVDFDRATDPSQLGQARRRAICSGVSSSKTSQPA